MLANPQTAGGAPWLLHLPRPGQTAPQLAPDQQALQDSVWPFSSSPSEFTVNLVFLYLLKSHWRKQVLHLLNWAGMLTLSYTPVFQVSWEPGARGQGWEPVDVSRGGSLITAPRCSRRCAAC